MKIHQKPYSIEYNSVIISEEELNHILKIFSNNGFDYILYCSELEFTNEDDFDKVISKAKKQFDNLNNVHIKASKKIENNNKIGIEIYLGYISEISTYNEDNLEVKGILTDLTNFFNKKDKKWIKILSGKYNFIISILLFIITRIIVESYNLSDFHQWFFPYSTFMLFMLICLLIDLSITKNKIKLNNSNIILKKVDQISPKSKDILSKLFWILLTIFLTCIIEKYIPL